MIDRIKSNLDDFIQSLDHTIRFLWKRPHPLDAEVLSMLSVEGKIVLLQKLIIEQSKATPRSKRADYLRRFKDDLTRCADAEKLRNRALFKYLTEPNGTWLRELVDADDGIVSAWFIFDESMSCEHERYVRFKHAIAVVRD
jgi:hypothetical protein